MSDDIVVADDSEQEEVAAIFTRLLVAVNPSINAVSTYDIVLMMLKDGLTKENAVDWGVTIAATAGAPVSKATH